MTLIGGGLDLDIDRPQGLRIGCDDIDQSLAVIGLASDITQLGQLSEHIELAGVANVLVPGHAIILNPIGHGTE